MRIGVICGVLPCCHAVDLGIILNISLRYVKIVFGLVSPLLHFFLAVCISCLCCVDVSTCLSFGPNDKTTCKDLCEADVIAMLRKQNPVQVFV